MIHTLRLGVGSAAALDFWEQRLGSAGYEAERDEHSLRSATTTDWPLSSPSPPVRIPRWPRTTPRSGLTMRSRASTGARAYGIARGTVSLPDRALGFTELGGGEYRLDGERARSPGPTTTRPAAGPAGRGNGPSHRLGLGRRGPPRMAATRTPGRRPSPTFATATTSSRFTSASRRASCSRLPPCLRALQSTRIRPPGRGPEASADARASASAARADADPDRQSARAVARRSADRLRCRLCSGRRAERPGGCSFCTTDAGQTSTTYSARRRPRPRAQLARGLAAGTPDAAGLAGTPLVPGPTGRPSRP